MRASLLVSASLLLLALPVLAGDEAPDPVELAHDYVSDDAADRASAEERLAGASADLLREVLKHVRECGREDHDGHEGHEEHGKHDEVKPSKDLVQLQVRFLEVTSVRARELALADDHGRIATRLLSAEEVARLLASVEKDDGVRQVTAPSITAYDRQKVNVNVSNQASYVQDFDVETQGDATIADPVVGTVQDGVALVMTPRIAPDGKEVLVDMTIEVSELVRPMEEHVLGFRGTELRIQLPEVRASRFQRRVAVPDGRTLLVGGASGNVSGEGAGSADRRLVVLLEATRLEGAGLDLVPPNFVPVPPKRRELPDSPSGGNR
jgi:hypothetical protein